MNFFLLIYFILFLIQIISCTFVYNDSKKRGMNSILWIFIVLLFPNLLGLIIYLAFRSQKYQTINVSSKTDAVKTNNHFIRKHELCRTCGRELLGHEDKCPYCNSFTDIDFTNMEYVKENIKRKKVISIIALFTAVIMFVFFITVMIPFRFFIGNKSIETFKDNLLQTNNRTETNNLLKNKYSYWDGKDEKVIEIHNSGLLNIEYELQSKEGVLYAVIKNSNNKVLKTIPGNINETFKIEVDKGENYSIIVVGQGTRGYYKFEWNLN